MSSATLPRPTTRPQAPNEPFTCSAADTAFYTRLPCPKCEGTRLMRQIDKDAIHLHAELLAPYFYIECQTCGHRSRTWQCIERKD